ncbi:hypothetical protein [Nonomuraea typhae]|uniref:VWA domain-containing protein n=1 Tax=Nonomuraea typhae TaxID=2603600 RepID=A0ABW7YYW6_9ACTN
MLRPITRLVGSVWLQVLGVLLRLVPLPGLADPLMSALQEQSARRRQFAMLIRRAKRTRPPAVSSADGLAILGAGDAEGPPADPRLVEALEAHPFVVAVETGNEAATRGLPAALLTALPDRPLIAFRDNEALRESVKYEDLLHGSVVWLGDLSGLLPEGTIFSSIESWVGFGDVKIAATIEQKNVIRHPVLDQLAEVVVPEAAAAAPPAVRAVASPPAVQAAPTPPAARAALTPPAVRAVAVRRRRRHRTRGGVAALIVVVGAATTTQTASAPATPVCARLQQLNLLTVPEMLVPLTSLAAMFERSAERCARLHVSVAPAKEVIEWVRQGWPEAAQRTAPLPHVWIPASTLETHPARGGVFTLQPLSSVASSPIVLAMSKGSAEALASSGGFSWALVHRLLTNEPAGTENNPAVARPVPRGSGAGTLITAMLYGTAPGAEDDPTTLHSLEQSLQPLLTGRNELCRHTQVAALTSEVSAHEQTCGGVPLAQFTADAATWALDYPFVKMVRPGTANRQRMVVADRFHRFLHTPRARKVFAEHRLRDPVAAPGLDGARVAKVLSQWDKARRSVRVLALMDVTRSMSGAFGGTAEPRMVSVYALLRRTLGSLSAKDQAGVWVVPGKTGRHDEIVSLRPGPPAGLPASLAPTRAAGIAAELPETLRAALRRIDEIPVGRPPPLEAVLLITHGQDASQIVRFRPTGLASVFVIALTPGSCARRSPLAVVADQTGGACYEAVHHDGLTQAFDKVSGQLWGGRPEHE